MDYAWGSHLFAEVNWSPTCQASYPIGNILIDPPQLEPPKFNLEDKMFGNHMRLTQDSTGSPQSCSPINFDWEIMKKGITLLIQHSALPSVGIKKIICWRNK